MKMVGVYGIFNLLNNKVYIGSTVNIDGRWYVHKRDLRNNCHRNVHLQRSWNKNKENNFNFRIVEICENKINDNNLILREQYWINYYKSLDRRFGYNIEVASPKGKTSEETKRKISLKNKGRKISEKQKEQISKSKIGNKYWFGRRHSKESKKKISNAKKGQKISDATKKKISEALIGRVSGMLGKKHSDTTKEKMSNSLKGRVFTDKHRENLSISGKKRVFTEEHRKNLSESGKIMWKNKKINMAN